MEMRLGLGLGLKVLATHRVMDRATTIDILFLQILLGLCLGFHELINQILFHIIVYVFAFFPFILLFILFLFTSYIHLKIFFLFIFLLLLFLLLLT